MYSEQFKTAVKDDVLKRIDEDKNFASQFNELYNTLGEESLRNIAYEEYAKKPEFKQYLSEKGIWETVKAFGRDVAQVPSEIAQGWNSTTDQMRMPLNALQGDQAELDELVARQKAYQPLPQAETKFGGTLRDVANMIPFMGINALAGFGGGAVGSVASPAGTTAGAIIGAGTTSALQGWGEMYGRLVNEGIDKEDAKGIATIVAPLYAGIELTQLRKIPVIGQFADKYLSKPFKDYIVNKYADKLLKGKLTKALGKYAGEVIAQSHEEGLQESVLNAGEQYGRNDGFNNFNLGENAGAYANAFTSSLAPMAVIQAPNMALRLRKTDQDRIAEAIEEGKNIQSEKKSETDRKFIPVPEGVTLGAVFTGADGKTYKNVDGRAVPFTINTGDEESNTSNLDADAESESKEETKAPTTNQKTAQDIFFGNLDNFTPPKENANILNLVENQIHQQKLQDEFAELSNKAYAPQTLEQSTKQAYAPQIINDVERQNLKYEQAKKLEAEKKLQAESELEDYIEQEIERQKEVEKQKKKREKKARELKNKLNRKNNVSDSIAKIDRLDYRLDAMDQVYEFGDVDKLTDDQLFEAYENGLDWAEKEIQKREEASGAGITLLEAMREGGYKLPTPAAIVRHAKRNNRGLSTYLYGEIKDLYDSLPKDKQLKYFSRNYTNTDEFAEELADYGFKYDSEGDFIADVAENLSGRKVSTGMMFSLSNSDYSAMSDQELIDAHAKAERANDVNNGRAITDEWLKRKGYNIDVYHGSPNHNINEFKEESYFTKNEDYAKRYKRGENGKIYETKLNLKKPFDTRNPQERAIFENEFYRKWGNGAPLSERGLPDWTDGSDLLEFLDENGYDYDGVILDEGADGGYGEAVNQRGESYVPRNASQIKSRDAFTYDDDGKYIPLDKRGDVNNADIRYSIKDNENAFSKKELNKSLWKDPLRRKFATTVKNNIEQFKKELEGKILNEEQQGIYDVSVGNKRIYKIKTDDLDTLGEFVTYLIGGRRKGARKIMFKHYGENAIGKVKAEEILQMGEIIRRNNPIIQGDIRTYEEIAPDGVKLRVVVGKDKKDNSTIMSFYADNNERFSLASKPFTKQKELLQRKTSENLYGKDSENSTQSQAKIESIVDEIESIKARFNKKAKFKSKVDVVGTVQKARQLLHSDDIPSDARGIQTGEKIVLVAENLDDAETGARVFLHEQVGHFGLRRLLGKDLKPFLNYVIKHYEGTKAWNKIASKKEYAKQGKYAIAEEMLAHLAENRELSDPSMWKRLVHRVKRAIWGNGVPQEYVNLLNEDTLRSAIALSREWAKGNHYLNANGVWESVNNIRRAKDVPKDKNYSLNDEQAQRQYDEVVAKYKDTDQWLKAPNGKDTNLTEEQWVMVRTPNFKNWFGDWENDPANASKVVDENGEPLVVYHGTSSTNDDYSNFTIFKNEDNQHFFSDEKDVANSMGEYLYESFLNIKKPFEIDANGDDFGDVKNHKGGIVHFSKLTDEQRKKLAIAFDVSEQELEENWGNQDIDLVRANVERRIGLSTDEWAKRARTMKYDGVVFTRIRDGGDYSAMQNPSTVYVAFNSNQIKSATDNLGTFDSANDDIRFSYKETRSQEEIDELNAKFKDLYEQYKNTTAFERLKVIKQAMDLVKEEAERKGYVVKVYHGTGADGFNVAKADSSEEQNGEGNQAHGAGLYMAVSRDTAERYQSRAEKDTYYVIAGKKISEYGFDDLGLSKGYIYEIFTVAKSGGVEREIKEYESRLKLKKGFLEDLKESLPEQQKDPDFSMMMFNSAVQSYEFDINRYKKVIEGLEHLQNVLEENGLDESDIELVETEGHLFNWLTNLNDDNTLDEDWAIYQHEKPVQEAYKKAYEEDILPILKESYGFDEDELESAKRAFDTSREVGDIVRSARTYIGADKFREIMLKHGIKGLTYDGQRDGRCYVSFEGGSTVKLQDPFTFDDNGELIPLSERFDEGNADMRFSLVEEDSNADIPLSISEKKNLEKFKQNIKKGSSRLDVSKNKAYKNNGLNCDRIIVHKFVLDEAEKLGIDSDKIPYELLRPTKIFGGNKDIKNIRILTTLKGKQNRLVCLQGSRDVNNIVVLRDILGYREERIDDLLEIESIYTNEKKARLLKNRANYTDNQTDTISSPNELSKIVSSDFSKESQDEKFENTMNYADEILQTKRNKVIYSLRQMGVDVIEDKRVNDKSQYIEVNLDNGGTIYVRVSDHPAKTRIDVSIEQDWKAGTRFIYDQVNKNDWGTKENPYWQGDARLRFSLADDEGKEKYDGRFGKAQRKYTKLLGEKRRELGQHVEYDDLPDIATDDEFKSVVGMTKKEYADLMQERDKVANEMRHEYQKTGQKFKQAQVDRYNPIKIIERIMNGGDLLGAEKSAYKSLFTAGNMDEVMYNAIYVGLPQYDRKSGTYKIRKGYKPLIQYFEKVKGKKYDNFQNYAQAVAMLEHYARSHNLETIEDALKWADSKEFEQMAGFTKADARKWIDEATQGSKDTVEALQELFRANREFMVETGLASSKQAEILNSFEYYLPMLRQFEDADTILSGDGGGFKSRGFSGRSSGVKEFIGSKAKIKNVMESIIERTASLYANGYKNVAMQRNIQMLSEFGLAKHAMKASVRVQARIEQAKNALEREGIKVENVRDESELIPLEAFHIINSIDEQIRDNIVSVRSNGNLIFYHIADPELLVALKSLGAEQQKLITTLFTKAKNVMTWGVTKLPAFAVRNFLRDTGGNAIILGNNPAKSVVNFAKSIKDTPQMQSIRMSGMGGASWYPVSATGATLDFGKGNAWKKAKRVGKYILTPFKAYDRILQASEQANRISAYDKAIAEGLSEAEASFRASDVLNFGMRGSGVWTGKNYYAKSAMEILSWLIRISPFVNAGIQGLFKAYREAGFEKGFFDAKDEFSKKAKAKKVMQALNKSLLIRGAILASASVLYSIYANSSEDDDGEKWYEKLSDDEKLSYWHFYMGDNKILRVPKPFEIGYLFSTIPTAMTDAMLQDNPETAKLLWRGMTDQLRFDFASNPIIDTAIENWRNKDSFRKTPIVERSDLNLPSQMQYSADTTSTAKALSIIPNMIPLLRDTWASSPARVQNMLDNFFGGMSQYGTYLTDSIVESFSSIEGGTSRYARKTPVERAYEWSLRDTRTMRYKNAEKFYELKGRIDELYASARLYKQTQQLDKLQELIDENTAEFGNYEIVNALNTKLREIATKRRKLGETKTYSVEEMIELDDKLLAERNKLLNYTDIIIERIENGEYNQRDLREIKKRIDNAGKSRKESKKADRILKGLR